MTDDPNEATNAQQPERLQAAIEAWGQYRAWAAVARHSKSGRQIWRMVILSLTFIGMILVPAAKYADRLQLPAWVAPAVTYLSAILVALVAYMNKELLGPASDQRWLKARSVAERTKGEVFRFLMNALPYPGKPPVLLLDKMEEIVKTAGSLVKRQLDEKQRTEGFPGYPLSIDDYLKIRLEHQLRYFRDQAKANDGLAKWYRTLGMTMSGLVLVLGVSVPVSLTGWASFMMESTQVWGPVLGAAAALLATRLSQGRYQFLADEYQAASSALEFLRARWKVSTPGDDAQKQLVAACEEILSRQNATWYNELSRQIQVGS